MYITLGTLFTLASTVWITNFKRNSPFADMLPSWTQLFFHPISFFRTFFEVVKLTSAHNTAETMERRKRKVEDVSKRAAYRKAHGLENDQSFGGWTAKSDEQLLGPAIPIGDTENVKGVESQDHVDSEHVDSERKTAKKWLGIW